MHVIAHQQNIQLLNWTSLVYPGVQVGYVNKSNDNESDNPRTVWH